MEAQTPKFTNELFKVAGSISVTKKEEPKPVESDFLFEDEKPSRNEETAAVIKAVVEGHPEIFAKVMPKSKTYDAAFKALNSLTAGTFFCGENWDVAWKKKILNCPTINLNCPWTLKEIKDACDRIAQFLEANPSHWYRKCKHNLADFFKSRLRSGKFWSPFVELLLVNCCTSKNYEEFVGPEIAAAMEKIFSDCWFDVTEATRCKMYQGMIELYHWYNLNRELLITKAPANAVNLKDFLALLDLIYRCNRDTRFIYPSFTGLHKTNWPTFVSYCNRLGILL